MADKKQTKPQHEKAVFLVHLESGRVVSVQASSLKEAVELAKELDKEFNNG